MSYTTKTRTAFVATAESVRQIEDKATRQMVADVLADTLEAAHSDFARDRFMAHATSDRAESAEAAARRVAEQAVSAELTQMKALQTQAEALQSTIVTKMKAAYDAALANAQAADDVDIQVPDDLSGLDTDDEGDAN